tara:strand:+ start:2323 stop:2499 length:177 start_codon:yes stop_codon:yes gene_type:complete
MSSGEVVVTAAVVTRVEARMIVAMHMIVEETLETARVTLIPYWGVDGKNTSSERNRFD